MNQPPTTDGAWLVIAGASTRAAAHSAIRAGLRPSCADYFGDLDLRAVCRQVEVVAAAADLPAAVASLPEGPWMYTGGLENHPDIVDQIDARRPLLGNASPVLAKIRDPWWVAECLHAAGLPALEVFPRDQIPARRDGHWLRKPLRSTGGRRVELWEATAHPAFEPVWFQRFVTGSTVSAQFIATPEGAALLGVTRQLIGDGAGPGRFAWRGAVGPIELPPAVMEQVHSLGNALAQSAGLRGAFGCDLVIAGDVAWLTEVNPRYTAAMEVLEHALEFSVVGSHVRACEAFLENGGLSPEALFHTSQELLPRHDAPDVWGHCDPVQLNARAGIAREPMLTLHAVLGKSVLYADRDLVLYDEVKDFVAAYPDHRLPFAADLPPPGQTIFRGQPVCSVFARERTEEDCLARLIENEAFIRRCCQSS